MRLDLCYLTSTCPSICRPLAPIDRDAAAAARRLPPHTPSAPPGPFHSQACVKVVFLIAVLGVVGSRAPTAFGTFNRAGAARALANGRATPSGERKDFALAPLAAPLAAATHGSPCCSAAPTPVPSPLIPCSPPPAGACTLAAGSPVAASNATCAAINLQALGNAALDTCPDKVAATFTAAGCNFTCECLGPAGRARLNYMRAYDVWAVICRKRTLHTPAAGLQLAQSPTSDQTHIHLAYKDLAFVP